jgi:hypothetical protein
VLLAAKKSLTLVEFFQTSRGSWLALAIVIVVMFGLLAWFTKWWRDEAIRQNSPEDLLLEFRNLHKQGELTSDEYRSVRERLVQKTGRSDDKDNSTGGCSDGGSAGTPAVP